MKKLVVLVVLAALLVPALVGAQEVGKTDNRLFGVQMGFVGGYNLNIEDTMVGRDFGLNFTLTDSMQLGFRAMSGFFAAGDAVMIDFGYFLSPTAQVDLMVGSDSANIVGGLEAAYTLFRGADDEVFSSAMKLKAGYIFNDALGIDKGVINVGLVGTLGY